MYKLSGVTKNYHKGRSTVAALRGVDLVIEDGEWLAVQGPTGHGKSTLLQILGGLDRPSSGIVEFDGRDLAQLRETEVTKVRAQSIGFVFQTFNLIPTLSALENVEAALVPLRVGSAARQQRATMALEVVGLGDRLRHAPGELSGGQQQRVALARALVNRPRALLLDEPLGALDLKLRQAMQVELKRIQREVGITFVYVTHDQGEALTMSDRIAVMNDGLVEQLGSPTDIYEHPATRFVAGFIGTSNLLTGTASRVSGTDAVIEVGQDERIVVPVRGLPVTEGSVLELTVRPEKIELTTERPPPECCALRGTVTEVVYLGTSTNFSVSTSTGADMVVFKQNSASADLVAQRGDAIWLSWQPQHSYLIG
jgi:spermidine/putrescine transport system ATP-binding protein